MNKIQYIKLLAIRGITELKGITLAQAVELGGNPTLEEMVKVNEESMKHFLDELMSEREKNKELSKKIVCLQNTVDELDKREQWLICLEAAGVDNWEGYDYAAEMYNGKD